MVSAPNYYYESTPPLESDIQRQQHMAAASVPRVPIHPSSYAQQTFAAPQYMAQPTMASYYAGPMPPAAAQSQISGLYYQRPLPQVRRPLSNSITRITLTRIGFPSAARRCSHGLFLGLQPMATPPLHLPLFCRIFPPITGPIHLPDLQQGFLPTQLSENPQPFAHGREALQVPSFWMRQGLQRS